MAEHHTPLQPADIENLAKARDWIKEHFTDSAEERYGSVEGKLRVIDAILQNGWVAPHETEKLQSLGVAFGDAVAQQLNMDWVIIEDEYGCEPALNWPGTSVNTYPVTIISKRVADGETPDIYTLFEDLCERISELALGSTPSQPTD